MTNKAKAKLWKRIVMSASGVLLLATAVTLYKYAALGVDPLSSLVAGLDELLPMEFGTVYLLANGILLIVVLFVDRHYIGLTTFINLFLVGYVVEWGEKLLGIWIPQPALGIRILLLIGGILLLCFALAMLMRLR